jgi:hypothetical protein
VFHYDVVAIAVLAGIKNRQDIRMLQHADYMGFIEKHLPGDLGSLTVGRGIRVIDLYRNVAAIIRIVREVDVTRCAFTDLFDNFVFADPAWNRANAGFIYYLNDHASQPLDAAIS